jgi:hypothetical protein
MTHTPTDLGLAPDAGARFEDYLNQVRAAVARAPDVNPDEIESDIREHVEHELRGAPRPVSLGALEAVLTRLGPPSQWGAAGSDPTLLHRARHLLRGARTTMAQRLRNARAALWSGPEDWRLTYLSFGLFALGILTFGALLPVCLPLSYLLSRAGLAHAQDRGESLGARKWLLYPPVVIVSLALLIATVAWPVVVGGVVGEEVAQAQDRVARFEQSGAKPAPQGAHAAPRPRGVRPEAAEQVEEDRKLLATIPAAPVFAPAAAGLFVGAGVALLWWALLGVAIACFPRAVRAVFCPLCDRLESRHGGWLALVCVVLLVPWATAAREVVAALV